MKALVLLTLLVGVFPDNLVDLDRFRVSFTQTTTSPLFPDEIRDEGILVVDGCHFRFEYTTHEKRTTIGDCENVYQYLEGTTEPMVFPWSDLEDNPFLQLLINRGAIRSVFVWEQLPEDPLVYRVVPKKPGKDTPFMMLKITLNADESLPSRIEVIDETQQVTTYTFTNFETDVKVDPSLFTMEDQP